MTKIVWFGIVAVIAAIVGLVTIPGYAAINGDMDRMDKDMDKRRVFIRGDLTAPMGDKPFGGEDVGSYLILVKDHKTFVAAKFDGKVNEGMVLEGWLVDMDTGYKLSTGQLVDNKQIFKQIIVNPFIYDLYVITEEPMNDTDPNANVPVGGAMLQEPFGQ